MKMNARGGGDEYSLRERGTASSVKNKTPEPLDFSRRGEFRDTFEGLGDSASSTRSAIPDAKNCDLKTSGWQFTGEGNINIPRRRRKEFVRGGTEFSLARKRNRNPRGRIEYCERHVVNLSESPTENVRRTRGMNIRDYWEKNNNTN